MLIPQEIKPSSFLCWGIERILMVRWTSLASTALVGQRFRTTGVVVDTYPTILRTYTH